MPDTKITALAAITTVAPANDLFPIVDVSDNSMAASGTTKNITVNQLLGAGGTATLASATITGDLTVRTNKLAVTNIGVGFGTTSPIVPLDVRGASGAAALFLKTTDPTAPVASAYIQSPVSTGFSSTVPIYGFWYQNSGMGNPANDTLNWIIGSGEAMRLNSTGLGVGAAPSYKLHIAGTPAATSGALGFIRDTFATNANSSLGSIVFASSPGTDFYVGKKNVNAVTSLSFGNANTGAELFQIDSAGNVGVSVTPSAWGTYKGLQVGLASLAGYGTQADTMLGANVFFDGTNYKYIGSYAASQYRQQAGVHSWHNVGAGTAGNTFTFTQAMTLDASGNLLIGTTSAAGVRLDVQTTTGNCIGRVKSNAAASTASFIIDYVETLGCTYIKKAASDVWIYGVQNDTSATPAFKINTASNVGVQLVSGSTAWTTLSDETTKDIIEPISNAVSKVGSLRSVIGKFKTDDASKRRSFLIAQDVQSVLPEAVDVIGENNELGLRYTEVIPLLVAAIKELSAEVNALKKA